MKVIVREKAFTDLERIHDWIAKDSPANASKVAERILDAIENKIAYFPFVGRARRKIGTREWIVRGLPYIIIYQVDETRQAITVLAIFHGAQNR